MLKERSKIGQEIRKHRRRLGLSQKAFGQKTKVSQFTITRIELGDIGNPKIKTLQKIADFLGIKVDDLL